MAPEVGRRGLAKFADVFCEEGVFSAEETEQILRKCAEYGMKATVHTDEIKDIGGIDAAVAVGAVSASHLAATSDENIKKLSQHRITAILLPGTPFVLMENTYPRARAMIEAGVPVALSTDLNPNCWTENMQMIITLACLNMKMLPEEAITASTINAAYALGIGDRVGSIEVGKDADLVLYDVPNIYHIPYRFGVNNACLVMKKGRVVWSKES